MKNISTFNNCTYREPISAEQSKYDINEFSNKLIMTVKIKSMKAIWLDDDLEKLKKEVSECIEGIINYEMSSSLGKFISLLNQL